jgi:hypothetical protein
MNYDLYKYETERPLSGLDFENEIGVCDVLCRVLHAKIIVRLALI